MRKKISVLLKILTIAFSLTGVVLGLVFYKDDGYSYAYKRLLYFTNQSNVWIMTIMVVSLFVPHLKCFEKKRRADIVYLIKYIFTVSITLTGIVFCGLLGPFAGDEYDAWSFVSLCTHVFTPIFAISDFFVDDYKFTFKKGQVLLSVIPPLAYFIFALILGACEVDFGRGDAFPYFFLNFKTPAGFFGFARTKPYPTLGSVYWILLCVIIVIGVGLLFKRLSPTTVRVKKQQKQKDN